jgi:hypothetical protein
VIKNWLAVMALLVDERDHRSFDEKRPGNSVVTRELGQFGHQIRMHPYNQPLGAQRGWILPRPRRRERWF